MGLGELTADAAGERMEERRRPDGHEEADLHSEEPEKRFHIEMGLLQDVRQCRALDRPMGWNSDLEGFGCGPFLEPNVAALLADDQPTIAAQGIDHLLEVQTRDFAQTATSKTSVLGAKSQSSSIGSR